MTLSEAELAQISDAIPVGAAAGLRYPEAQMKSVYLLKAAATRESVVSKGNTMQTMKLSRGGPEGERAWPRLHGHVGIYGPADEAESIATIHAAIDAGINLLDTGDFYGMGHNEMLIGRAIEGAARQACSFRVKFGAMRGPDGKFIGFDARPAAVKNFLAYTLQRLGMDHIDMYRPARLDPDVPIEDTIGAIADMIKRRLCPAYGAVGLARGQTEFQSERARVARLRAAAASTPQRP